jgi:O-antigen/teichoic acid export membrane protein
MTFFLIPYFGLIGTAIATIAAQAIYLIIMSIIVKNRSGKYLSPKILGAILMAASLLGIAYAGTHYFPGRYFGLISTLIISAISAGLYFYISRYTITPNTK